ncbi:MoeB/ThiF family adenylyltransferase [Salimicrobium sp. PL1-032A]|uniref:MoeB/ThiF family adenylyltransferase n=1 Tax=Salimicrobium sp. PL1-032A TaxID=3095364 RepID=UPI00325FE457
MKERYSRQTLFSPIGESGQAELMEKHVILIGAGALGAGNAETLVRAGVGRLTIIDRDYVEWSNLQRQQLYTETDARRRLPKAVAAQKHLTEVNSDVRIEAHVQDATPLETEPLIKDADVIIDATDNFEVRMMINDLAGKHSIPWIYGACVGSYGLSHTVLPGHTPCLNCLLSKVPLGGLTCDTAGIISPVVQRVVSHQSVEAMKILVGDWSSLRKTLVSFDLWKNEEATIDVTSLKDSSCPTCGKFPDFPYLDYNQQMKTAELCGRDAVQIRPGQSRDYDLGIVEERLKHQSGTVERNPYLLSFTSRERRIVLFKDGRALIHGTNDKTEAKAIYHRYFG